jgi:plasmid stabilization system protein ParE
VSYVLHDDARRDLAEATAFYKQLSGAALASRFLDEFEHAARLLVEYPELGTPLARGRRLFPLQVFPYALVYRKLDYGVCILIVRHTHRRPGFGGGRR